MSTENRPDKRAPGETGPDTSGHSGVVAGAWSWLRGFFTTDELDRAAEARREREQAERIERLARDPFAFRSEEEWLAFRRRHGYRTRRPRR